MNKTELSHMETNYTKDAPCKKPLVVAHRGGGLLAPENTIAAFKNAIKLGVDRIELDVQLSKDNVVVVIHDEKINRTTNGKGRISDMTYAEMAVYDTGCKFSEKYRGEHIPVLEEVLELVNGKCTLLIEVKNPENMYKGLEKKIADLISRYNAKSWCVVQSFEYESLYSLHKIDHEITLGLLMADARPGRPNYNNINISFISEININQRFANQKSIDFLHGLNKKTFIWTVNKCKRMQHLIRYGVDGIITDNPAMLQELMRL